MISSIKDALAPPSSASPEAPSPRQRLDELLARLPPGGTEASQASAADPARAELVEPVQRINEVMRSFGVEFELGDDASRLITRLIDRENGEVIRQIPSEEVLRVAERIDELRGRLIRDEA